jgi:hypothetical protein
MADEPIEDDFEGDNAEFEGGADEAFEDEEEDELVDDDIAEELDFVAADDEETAVDVDEDSEEESDEETDEALDELEAEELELIDDEVTESLLVDEVAELRAIRREELTMNVDAQAVRAGEFVCQSCFLVKRTSQLADGSKMICLDCAP